MATTKTTTTEIKVEQAELLFTTKQNENLQPILDYLIKEDVFYTDPKSLEIGKIESIEVLDKTTRDKQNYSQIQLNVRANDGKKYVKQWSIDFTRKYLTQIGFKAKDIVNAVVVFKPDNRFKNIKAFMFVTWGNDATGSIYYEITPYVNEDDANVLARLDKLGI